MGNLSRSKRNALQNILPIVLVPPGMTVDEALEPFKAEIKQLQRGKAFDLGKNTLRTASCSDCPCENITDRE